MKRKIIIYQTMPRLFGNSNKNLEHNGSIETNGCGKLADYTPEILSEIRNLGATHIWYTGLIEHATKTNYSSSLGIAADCPDVVKGNAGSPYAIKDYYDIDPDLATNKWNRIRECNSLFKRTHRAGLKIIIDFVPNHVARQYHSDAKPDFIVDLGEDDNKYLKFSPMNNFYYNPDAKLSCNGFCPNSDYMEYPAKATGNDHFDAYPGANDWYETIKLNYGIDYLNNRTKHFNPIPSTWQKMLEILEYWADFGIDGFRCDMAEMVPVEFWNWAISKIKANHPQILFIAEVYNPEEYSNYIYTGGFDYLYDKVGLYDTLRSVVCNNASTEAITHSWQTIGNLAPRMLNFLENHDEQRIASDFFAGYAKKGIPAAIVSCLMNSNPFMIYNGQEFGERGMDEEGFSGKDGRTTIFDYWSMSTIRKWIYGKQNNEQLDEEALALCETYRKIFKISANKAIREGLFYDLLYANQQTNNWNPNREYAFIRKYIRFFLIIVANFSDQDMENEVIIPKHAIEYLKIDDGTFKATDILSGREYEITFSKTCDSKINVFVPAHNGCILEIDYKKTLNNNDTSSKTNATRKKAETKK